MYCVRKVTDDLTWIGANDRRLALFEGVYKIPMGVSYNSYVLLDEKTVVFDTVDASASKQYLENLDHVPVAVSWTMSSSSTWRWTTPLPWANWWCTIPK